LIEEVSHLGGHIAEARWSAEDDGVGFRQLRRFCHRHIGKCRAGNSRAALFQYLVGDEFRHLPQARLTGFAGAGGDRLRHLIDMPIHAVKDDLNSR
jgi:hypothetical protein